MADCPRSPNCPLFRTFSAKPGLKPWQGQFCLGGYETCARFARALAGKPVPLQLLPNGRTLEVSLSQLEAHHLC